MSDYGISIPLVDSVAYDVRVRIEEGFGLLDPVLYARARNRDDLVRWLQEQERHFHEAALKAIADE